MDRVVYLLLLCYPNQDIGMKRYIQTKLVGEGNASLSHRLRTDRILHLGVMPWNKQIIYAKPGRGPTIGGFSGCTILRHEQ
jgi:hypothetical protein